jgi:hypothetical protein
VRKSTRGSCRNNDETTVENETDTREMCVPDSRDGLSGATNNEVPILTAYQDRDLVMHSFRSSIIDPRLGQEDQCE